MHERSLVRALLDLAAAEAGRRGLGAVRRVSVEVGEFSGVEPDLVRSAFAELAPERFAGPVELDLRTVPLRGRCRACGAEFAVRSFRFVCAACGGEADAVAGEEFRLASLGVEPAGFGAGPASPNAGPPVAAGGTVR